MKASSPTRNSGLRRLGLTLVAGGLLVSALFLAVELLTLDGRLGLPLDDSWIHLAFARTAAEGHGLGLQPGTRVAGSTAPLWTGLIALGVLAPVSDLLWMKLLGALLHAGGVLLTWVLARGLGLGRGLAVLAAGFTLAAGWLGWSSLSGMEVPLFVFLTLAGLALHLTERRTELRTERAHPDRPPLSLAAFGVAALARPEGLLLVALAALDRLLRFRRSPEGALRWERPVRGSWARTAAGLGLAALAVVPVAAVHLWIGGSVLPTTLAAKTGGGEGLHLPDPRYLHTAAGILFQSLPWAAFLAPAGCVALVRRLGTSRDRGLLPALWLLGLPLAYACLTPAGGAPLVGNFGRYLFPLLPVVAVLGVLGLEPAARAVGAPGVPGSRARRWAAAAGVALLLWPSVTAAVRAASLYAHNLADVEAGDVRMARWLAERLPEEAVIATMDVGAMAVLLPNRLVDVAGIGDPELHTFVRQAQEQGGSWQDGVLAFLATRRPDYLVVFPEWLRAVEAPGSPFRRLHTIEIPGNVTLGRDVLALYATPWTRYPLRAPTEPSPGDETP